MGIRQTLWFWWYSLVWSLFPECKREAERRLRTLIDEIEEAWNRAVELEREQIIRNFERMKHEGGGNGDV